MQIPVTGIPNYVAASTPRALRRLMLKVNQDAGYGHTFYQIYYDPVSKKHIAWYTTNSAARTIEQEVKEAEGVVNGE